MKSDIKKLFVTVALLLIASSSAYSQVGAEVKGTVVDEKSQPVVGAAVLINNNLKLGGGKALCA